MPRAKLKSAVPRRIGFAVAEKLVDEGCAVVIADIRDAEAAARRLDGRAGAVIGLPLDVTSEA